MRSRTMASEYNYREIVVILYFLIAHHQLLPQQYYHDAVLCLMDLREMTWKNFSIIMVEPFKALQTLIIESLKTLFRVPSWNREHHEDFLCAICFEEYDWPHTLQCGHSLCYVCLSALLGSTTARNSRFNVWFKRYDIRKNSCPKCRQPIHGQFDRDEKKSAFVLDRKLLNQMYSDPITVDDGKCTFKGTECDFWGYLSSNHKMDHFEGNEVMKREFVMFCGFMKSKTRIYGKRERNESILKAREIKQNGNKLFGAKQYDEAIGEYQNALKICPIFHDDRATYYSNMALCYQRSEDHVNAFRAALCGLSLDPVHVKMLNTALSALDKLLRPHSDNKEEAKRDNENEAKNGNENQMDNETVDKDEVKNEDDVSNDTDDPKSSFFPYIHSNAMRIGKNNGNCLKHRAYDVIQYQLLWECEMRYLYKMASLHVDSHEYLAGLRQNDPFLKRLNKISLNIDHYTLLNQEEFQYWAYIMSIDYVLEEIHTVFKKEYEGLSDEEMKAVEPADAVTKILKAVESEGKEAFWLQFVNQERVTQISMFPARYSLTFCYVAR